MVSETEESSSIYIPPLDRCFDGRRQLLSWKTVHETLRDPNLSADSAGLQAFLQDEETVHVLSKCLDPPERSNPKAKTDFETRTAAINVTPSNNGFYDIKQIREDVIWLAEQAKIDHITALRTAIIEWQERPKLRILRGYTEEEEISLQQAVGSASFTLSAERSENRSKSALDAFNSVEQRHARLLRVWLAERHHLIGVVSALEILSSLDYPRPPPGRSYGPRKRKRSMPQHWIAEVSRKTEKIRAERVASTLKSSRTDVVSQIIAALQRHLEAFDKGSGWSKEDDLDPFLEEDYQYTKLLCVVYSLQILFVRINSRTLPASPNATKDWFELVEKARFFNEFHHPSSILQNLAGPVQSLVCIVSLQILKMPFVLDRLAAEVRPAEQHSLSILDVPCQSQINKALIAAADAGIRVAGPAMLAWTTILRCLRTEADSTDQNSLSSDEGGSPTLTRRPPASAPRAFTEALDCLSSTGLREDPVEFFAKAAVDQLQVFSLLPGLCTSLDEISGALPRSMLGLHSRVSLMEMVRPAIRLINYGPEILEATFALLDTESISSADRTQKTPYEDQLVADLFLYDSEVLIPYILEQTRDRYPFELAPFLRLSQLLSSAGASQEDDLPQITQSLMALPRLTQQLPPDFVDWELVGEDEGASCFKLTDDLSLFLDRKRKPLPADSGSQDRKALMRFNQEKDQLHCIPHGTIGYAVSDSKPHIVMWQHEHSAFALLGVILSTVPANSSRFDAAHPKKIIKDLQADIISLLAVQVRSACEITDKHVGNYEGSANAKQILQEASDRLDRDQDILTVIESIFDEELSQTDQRRGEHSIELLVACIDFIRALLLVMPEKALSIVTRSTLLDTDGRGKLRAVISATEVPRANFDFLTTCLKLFNDLVLDSVTRAVSRLSQGTKPVQRFRETSEATRNIPQRTLSKVLLACTRIAVDVMQSSPDWNFVRPEQRWEINLTINELFENILRFVYSYDDSQRPETKLMGALAPAAEYLVETFLAPGGNDFTLSPLLRICMASTTTTTPSRTSQLILRQTSGAIKLINTLLQVGGLLELPCSNLQKHILRALPLLVRLFISNVSLLSLLISTFTGLVESLGKVEGASPPLLGDLHPDAAKDFLSILGTLTRGLESVDVDRSFWTFFSTIVGNQQRWITTVMMTSETPRGSMNKDGPLKSTQSGPRSLLQVATDKLSELNDLDAPSAFEMLAFVAASQNHAPWVSQILRRHPKFLEKMIDHVENVNMKPSDDSAATAILHGKEIRGASLVLDTFAVYLHNMAQLGDISFIKALIPRLSFLSQHGVLDPSYNSSLHLSLKRNFEGKFSGSSPSNFKKVINSRILGNEDYYDIDFASDVLCFSAAWDDGRDGGYRQEFLKANYNLYLVEAQILAVVSWKLLATELSRHLQSEVGLQKSLGYVVLEAMEANRTSSVPEGVSQNLSTIRADLVFTILQRLIAIKSTAPVMQSMLVNFWNVVLERVQDFETTFTGEDIDYYRLLLKILLFCLQPGAYMSFQTNGRSVGSLGSAQVQIPPVVSSVLVEITTKVVANGFRSLASLLHDQSSAVDAADLALLTSILQSVLNIRGIELLHSQLALRLSDSGVHRYAISLFSWSDRLTSATDNDPIAGELSISFLLELSNIQPLAEFLATEGTLADLSTASLMDGFRVKRGVGPFEEPTRLFSIWSRGILPLCLNVLVAAGESFAAEAAMFLNSCAVQLERASSSLDAKSNPSFKDPTAGSITLSAACEAHTLSLISIALTRFRDSPSAAAMGEIPELKWDHASVKDDVEIWVQGTRAALRERIIPMTEREMALKKAEPLPGKPCGCESRLEQMILSELMGASVCLGGGS